MHFICIVLLCQSASSDILKCPFPLIAYTEKNTSEQPFDFLKKRPSQGFFKSLLHNSIEVKTPGSASTVLILCLFHRKMNFGVHS